MSQYFSPREVALAIGVSESSLKRWVDKGLINAEKTAGGHRRLKLDAVLQFLRNSGRALEHPEKISLPVGCATGSGLTASEARDSLARSLSTGDEQHALRVVLDLYLSGMSISELADSVITETFHHVGDLWNCGEIEIYQERLACELCQRIIHELRRIVGAGPLGGPVAMGGTLDGDPYTLASSLAELVIRDAGWNAQSLGNMLPFETLRQAVRTHSPGILWVSVSAIRDVDRFAADFNLLYDVTLASGTSLLAGGRALTAEVRQRIRYTHYSDNYRHLESIAKTILQRTPAPTVSQMESSPS